MKLNKIKEYLKVILFTFLFTFLLTFQTAIEYIDEKKEVDIVYASFVEKEKECLVEALWYEARGEGEKGLRSVLSVLHNRKNSKYYPDTYCKVVDQPMQFSYRNNYPSGYRLNSFKATYNRSEHLTYTKILKLAEKASKGLFKPNLKPSVMWYHSKAVKPYWTKGMKVVAKIEGHIFYKKV